MGKPPKVLKITKEPFWEEDEGNLFDVYITHYQLLKLPSWVQGHLNYHYDHETSRRIYLRILAKDELQALTRFNKLWAGLPKE